MAIAAAFGVWVMYLALEPYARRVWPTMLIGWSRLLSGKPRDPLVGKSLLVGLLLGVSMSLVRVTILAMPQWVGETPLRALWYYQLAYQAHQPLAVVLDFMANAVMYGLGFVLLLVLLKYLLARQWLVTIAFLMIVPVMMPGSHFNYLPWGPIVAMIATLALLLLLRWTGVLAAMAFLFCDGMFNGTAMTTELTAWYAHATLIPVGVILALTGYALYAATYGRPKIQAGSLES